MVVFEEVQEVFDYAKQINVYNTGIKIEYREEDLQYKKILSLWKELIENSHQMPAFGVSLDRETKKEINNGVWIEFEFNCELKVWEMPFEKLLCRVEKDSCGFNLCRFNPECGYDGRCFYLDLNGKNMCNLYNLLVDLK